MIWGIPCLYGGKTAQRRLIRAKGVICSLRAYSNSSLGVDISSDGTWSSGLEIRSATSFFWTGMSRTKPNLTADQSTAVLLLLTCCFRRHRLMLSDAFSAWPSPGSASARFRRKNAVFEALTTSNIRTPVLGKFMPSIGFISK